MDGSGGWRLRRLITGGGYHGFGIVDSGASGFAMENNVQANCIIHLQCRS